MSNSLLFGGQTMAMTRKNKALTQSDMEFMRVSVLCADNVLHRAFHFSIRSFIRTEVFQYFTLEM